MGVRTWVEHQTHHPLGYLEQLYTFADRDRVHGGGEQRMMSISYLGSHPGGGRIGRAWPPLARLVSVLSVGGLASWAVRR